MDGSATQSATTTTLTRQRAYLRAHLRGQGLPESDKEAVKWIQKAADQGSAEAQQILEALKPIIHSKEAASVSSSELKSSSSTPTGCAKCGIITPNLRACSRCKVVSYCSKECQAAHWKLGHKAACGHH